MNVLSKLGRVLFTRLPRSAKSEEWILKKKMNEGESEEGSRRFLFEARDGDRDSEPAK